MLRATTLLALTRLQIGTDSLTACISDPETRAEDDGGRAGVLDQVANIHPADTAADLRVCPDHRATCSAGEFDNALNFRRYPHVPGNG